MSLAERIALVNEKIAAAARQAGREPSEVTLVAATKVQTSDTIRQAKETGHAYWLAELYRCRAVLRARGNVKTNLVAAELLTAVTIAESQGAMALLQRASRSTRELGVVIGR